MTPLLWQVGGYWRPRQEPRGTLQAARAGHLSLRRHRLTSSHRKPARRDQSQGLPPKEAANEELSEEELLEELLEEQDWGLQGLPAAATQEEAGPSGASTLSSDTQHSFSEANLQRQPDGSLLVDPAYARLNAQLVDALRSSGIKVRVGRLAGAAGDGDFIGQLGGPRSGAAGAAQAQQQEDDDDDDELDVDDGWADDAGGGSSLGDPSDAPRSGDASDWYKQLRAEGFDLQGAGQKGGVFLERRTSRPAGSSGSRTAAAAARPGAATQALRGLAAGGKLQQQPQQQVAPPKPRSFKSALSTLSTPQHVMDYVSVLYPAWASNGYRLVHMEEDRGLGAEEAPGPVEAAHALRAVATAARGSMRAGGVMGLARERVVAGLVECLRLGPPRLLDHQDRALSADMWDQAKAFWLEEVSDRVADPADRAAAGSAGGGAGSSSSSSSGSAAAASAAAGGGSSNGSGSGAATGSNGSLDGQKQLLAKFAQLSKAAAMDPAAAKDPQARLMLATARAAAAAGATIVGDATMQGGRGRAKGGGGKDAQTQEAFSAAIWALSVIGGPAYFAAEMDALLSLARFGSWRLSTAEGSDLLWSLANARHWSPRLPDIEAGLLKAGGLRVCKPREAASILWGFATLGCVPDRLLLTIHPSWQYEKQRRRGERSGGRAGNGGSGGSAPKMGSLKDFSTGQLSSMAWSLAVMQQVQSSVFGALWSEVGRRGMRMAKHEHHLVQVWQTAMAIRLEAAPGTHPGQGAPTASAAAAAAQGSGRAGAGAAAAASSSAPHAELLEAAERVFYRATAALRHRVHSTYQRSIANTLTSLRVMHMIEDNSSGYSIDITVPSLRLAIEADGPTHLARNDRRKMLGATLMKKRHLQQLGWQVINVPFHEWDALGSETERQDFIRSCIGGGV